MEPEEFSRVIGRILGSTSVTIEERNSINDAMGEADSIEELPDDIQQLLARLKKTAQSKNQSGTEARASRLSTVERRIVKQPNICKQCLENNDPANVPVHPNCDCDVITDSIESGVADPQSRFLKTLSKSIVDIETIVGDEFKGDLILDPETVAIMDAENVRFSDIARWLEVVSPYLDKLDRAYDYVSIVADDDTQDAIDQVQETVDELSEGTEDFAEAIKHKKLWFALAKAVAL